MSYNARNWAKVLIGKKLNAPQLIAETYKETLRFMLATFSGLKVINSQNDVISIQCINASPERTVAKLYQDNNIILPLVTVAQTNSIEDEKRRRTKDLVLVESMWDSTHKRAIRIISLAPKAININYELNVWTKYSEDMDQIVEQIRLTFSPGINVITKYTNSTVAFITEEANDSTLVVGDREDRIIRRKFSISVEGYIPYPKYFVTSTGEITEFNTEVQVIEDAVDLDASSIDSSSINISETQTYIQK